ncbi:hypothetical protein RFI_35910, partial [Reticulomyxa filosa]
MALEQLQKIFSVQPRRIWILVLLDNKRKLLSRRKKRRENTSKKKKYIYILTLWYCNSSIDWTDRRKGRNEKNERQRRKAISEQEEKDDVDDNKEEEKQIPRPYHRWICFKKKKENSLPLSASHADDGDHETQSMFSSIHCQLLKYIGLILCVPILGTAIVDVHGRELMLLCAIYYKKQQRRINQSTPQKSLHYLVNQNKSLDIINVLVALGPAEWIFEQHFMSAVEPLSLYRLSSLISKKLALWTRTNFSVEGSATYKTVTQKMLLPGHNSIVPNNGIFDGHIIIEINARIPTQEAQGIWSFVRLSSFLLSDAIIRARFHSLKKFLFY